MSAVVSVLGIIFVLIGAWFVAYEVVNKFTGISHTVSGGWGGSGTAGKTEAFIVWEAKRNKFMWVGLAFITIGSALKLWAFFASCTESKGQEFQFSMNICASSPMARNCKVLPIVALASYLTEPMFCPCGVHRAYGKR